MVTIVDAPDTITRDHATKRAVDESLSVQERVMLSIMHFYKGERDIFQSIDDFAGYANLNGSATYQALHRMMVKGQIEILKENINGTGRQKVVGVRLNKLPDQAEVIANGADKARNHRYLTRKLEPKVASTLKHLNGYMAQKIAISKAKDILLEAGLDPVDVSSAFINLFAENPLAEEALAIYKELNEVLEQHNELRLQVEADARMKETAGVKNG